MLEEIFQHSRRGESFVFETTLSGRGYARLIPSWLQDGYIITLFFLDRGRTEQPLSHLADPLFLMDS